MAASKTYRAITEVHITDVPGKAGDRAKGIAPTPPKVIIVPAKGLVDMDPDSDVCKELLGKKAIRLDDSDSKETPQKVTGGKKSAPAKKPAATKAEDTKKDDTKDDTKDDAKDDDSELV